MKKLRLSNIFHWLYAFLIFCPILSYLFQFVVFFGAGNTDSVSFCFEGFLVDTIGMSFESGIGRQLFDIFDYLFSQVLGVSEFSDGFNSLFAYWIVISIVWLVFDVLMFMINLAHRWIDKGGIE